MRDSFLIPRLTAAVAGGLSIMLTVGITMWIDRLGEDPWIKLTIILLSIAGSIVIPVLCLLKVARMTWQASSIRVISVITCFLLFLVRVIMPDGIELFGETLRNIPVEDVVNHPSAFAFTLRDAELRPQFRGEGLITRSTDDRIYIEGKGFAIPIVPHGWETTRPIRLWLVTSRTSKELRDTLSENLWPQNVTTVKRADLDGGTAACISAVNDAVSKYHLPSGNSTLVSVYDEQHDWQAQAWRAFYACLKLDAGIWLVACFGAWLIAWRQNKNVVRR